MASNSHKLSAGGYDDNRSSSKADEIAGIVSTNTKASVNVEPSRYTRITEIFGVPLPIVPHLQQNPIAYTTPITTTSPSFIANNLNNSSISMTQGFSSFQSTQFATPTIQDDFGANHLDVRLTPTAHVSHTLHPSQLVTARNTESFSTNNYQVRSNFTAEGIYHFPTQSVAVTSATTANNTNLYHVQSSSTRPQPQVVAAPKSKKKKAVHQDPNPPVNPGQHPSFHTAEEFETERNRLWNLLVRDYGHILDYPSICYEFALIFWYRWDHPRGVPWYGLRAVGKSWEAQQIIPGAFLAFPGANTPPIFPSTESIEKQQSVLYHFLRSKQELTEREMAEVEANSMMQDIPKEFLFTFNIHDRVGEEEVQNQAGVEGTTTPSQQTSEQSSTSTTALISTSDGVACPDNKPQAKPTSFTLPSSTSRDDNPRAKHDLGMMCLAISDIRTTIRKNGSADQVSSQLAEFESHMHWFKKFTGTVRVKTSSAAGLRAAELEGVHRIDMGLATFRAHFQNRHVEPKTVAERLLDDIDGELVTLMRALR